MARKDNTFIGVFNTQAEVLSKVTELKAQGYNENDMYVVGQDENSFSMVQNQTDVHVDAAGEGQKEDQGFMGKFMSALSGDSSSTGAFNGMGLDSHEEDEYRRQVQNGKLVLYVDSDYGDSYDRYSQSYNSSSGTGSTSSETAAGFGSGTTSGLTSNDRDTLGSSSDTSGTFGSSSSDNGGLFGSKSTDNDSTFGSTSSDNDSTFGSSSSDNGGLFGSKSSDNDSTFGSTSGTTGSSTGATGDTFGSSTDATTDEERLRLHEERLNVGTERVQTGEVNVGKHVVEENQSIEVPVEREEVYVERRPVNEEATDADAFRNTNETINVPVSEERVNVSKKDVVSEEIVVGKKKVQDTEHVNETVRREVADIDEDDNTTGLNNTDNNKKPF